MKVKTASGNDPVHRSQTKRNPVATLPVLTRNMFEVRDISVSYGEREVLSNVSITLNAGEIVALLGATGSGKTSLVNLLPRFYEYTGGSVTLDGIELDRYPRSYLRRQIGIVFVAQVKQVEVGPQIVKSSLQAHGKLTSANHFQVVRIAAVNTGIVVNTYRIIGHLQPNADVLAFETSLRGSYRQFRRSGNVYPLVPVHHRK